MKSLKQRHKSKKTRQGKSRNTRWGNKGGSTAEHVGSTKSKKYRKKYRGQGK